MNNLQLWQDDLFTRLGESFTDLFDTRAGGLLPILKKSGYPKVNIYQDDKNAVIEATVPGIIKENIRVDWKNDILTISYNTKTENKQENKNYFLKEIHQSNFSRSFDVQQDACDVNNIVAKVDNGILKITIPFKNPQKSSNPVNITIQ